MLTSNPWRGRQCAPSTHTDLLHHALCSCKMFVTNHPMMWHIPEHHRPHNIWNNSIYYPNNSQIKQSCLMTVCWFNASYNHNIVVINYQFQYFLILSWKKNWNFCQYLIHIKSFVIIFISKMASAYIESTTVKQFSLAAFNNLSQLTRSQEPYSYKTIFQWWRVLSSESGAVWFGSHVQMLWRHHIPQIAYGP